MLEGGYSVETALPYVNLGIIMAMAGIDYSNLYEPDYRKDIFKEERGNLKRLEDIVHELTGIFRLRQELAEKTRRQGSGSLLQRHRQIYYDTDQIRETQLETLKVCAECPGYLLIESVAIAGRAAIGLLNQHPYSVLFRCRQEARDHYAKMQRRNSNSFDYVYSRIPAMYTCNTIIAQKGKGILRIKFDLKK